MPWESIAERIPAFAALCVLVIYAGKHIREITRAYMTAIEAYMVQVRELSATCHESHREVSESTAESITAVSERATRVMDRNTESLNKLIGQQHSTELVLAGLAKVLDRANGGGK